MPQACGTAQVKCGGWIRVSSSRSPQDIVKVVVLAGVCRVLEGLAGRERQVGRLRRRGQHSNPLSHGSSRSPYIDSTHRTRRNNRLIGKQYNNISNSGVVHPKAREQVKQ